MKSYFYLFLFLFPFAIYSQTPKCEHKTNVPYEYISRIHTYQEPDELDGHSYAMFKKDIKDFDSIK